MPLFPVIFFPHGFFSKKWACSSKKEFLCLWCLWLEMPILKYRFCYYSSMVRPARYNCHWENCLLVSVPKRGPIAPLGTAQGSSSAGQEAREMRAQPLLLFLGRNRWGGVSGLRTGRVGTLQRGAVVHRTFRQDVSGCPGCLVPGPGVTRAGGQRPEGERLIKRALVVWTLVVGLRINLAGASFTISRSWPVLGGAAPPGSSKPQDIDMSDTDVTGRGLSPCRWFMDGVCWESPWC